MLAALFFTLSRAAWTGAAIGVAIFLILAAVAQGARRKIDRRVVIAGVAALALAGVLAAVLLAGGSRPDWLFRPSLGPRLDAARTGLEIWRDHFWTGAGPAGYALLYPEYSGRNPLLSVHAHNGYVQAGAELGLVGVATIGIGGLLLLYALLMGLKLTSNSARLVIISVLAGGAAFLAQSLWDATFEFKSVPAVLAVLIALGLAAVPQVEPARRSLARRLLLLAIVVMTVILLVAGWTYAGRAHFHYANGLALANAGRWTEAVPELTAASEQDPRNALYQFQAGLALAMTEGGTPDGEELDRAIQYLQEGLRLEPRSVAGWTNYGRLLALQGDREGARHAHLQAQRFGSQNVAAQLNAGIVFEQLGSNEDAVQAYVQALVIDSELVSSPFWSATEFRRSNRERIISGVVARLPLLPQANPAFDLSHTGQVSAVMRTRLDADLRRAQQLLLSGDAEAARTALEDAIAAQPDRAAAHALLGDVHAAQGRHGAAREAWFTAGTLGDIESLRKLGDSYGGEPVPASVAGRLSATVIRSGQFAVLQGTQHYWIGIQYYRSIFLRGSPRIILLPGEWEQVAPRQVSEAAGALERWSR
jgi:tetratricopeptide (TPR) repeat protein